MGYMETMIGLGATPKGFTQPQVDPEIDAFQKSMAKIIAQEEEHQAKVLEKKKTKFDMYKTLREAGYDSYRAWKAVREGMEMPEPPSEDVSLPAKATTIEDKIKKKVAEGEALTSGEKKIYDDTIRKRDYGLSGIVDQEEDEDYVQVISPKGVKGKYPKDKWNKNKQGLLRQGWREQ
jgi:hypothetical protein